MQTNRDGWDPNEPSRSDSRRGRRKPGVRRQLAVAVPMFVFALMSMIGIGAFFAVVAVFASYSQGLPETNELENLQFISESIVYDRTGEVELARFNGGEQREPVTFEQIPPILIDATTSTEDRSFWTNSGVDPLAIMSAGLDALRGRERGASTITQQLVRQRLLDPDLVRDPSRTAERKLKEIIQSVRVTDAYPGDEGKRRIITAYLNQNYYGNGSYGIKAAARSYFGVEDLNDLTLGQVALLAGLPQSPSSYDLVRNSVVGEDGSLYVPLNERVPIVFRRNEILRQMAEEPSRLVLTQGEYTRSELLAAIDEPIILTPQEPELRQWLAPHFIWALRDELAMRLCAGEETCPELEQGGLRVYSSLDYDLQQTAEKWVEAATILPQQSDPEAYAAQIGVPYERWMRRLATLEVNNGAMIAMDYQTGEIVAYVGSASYYRDDLASPQFQPQFDVLGDGWRQPGSAFKPFNYVTGINDGTMTASSMFMDVTTTFDNSNGYTPKNYDLLERGPLRMRSALQWSLNVPAVKAQVINGVDHVFDQARRFGMSFQTERPQAGLSLTLGTEVTHPRDVAVAFGTLGNGGVKVGYTHILRITNGAGEDLVPVYTPTAQDTVVSPQAAYVMTDILQSNTDPNQNPIWGEFALRGPNGDRRPATIKTGTSQDANDLVAFGYVPSTDDAGRQAGEYSLVVGAWVGNSDGSPVLTEENPVLSTDVAAPMWHGFLQEVTSSWPVRGFARPPGIVEADVDAWSGMAPTEFTRQTVREVFIEGTVPPADNTKVALQVVGTGEQEVPPGEETEAQPRFLLWAEGCAPPETHGFLALENVEAGHPDWQAANLDWINRARTGGPGTAGGPDPEERTRTSYTFNRGYTPYGRSWGAPFAPTESCVPGATPAPSLSLEPSPSLSPSLEITPEPTFEVTLPPPPTPTATPTNPPTEVPPPPTNPPPPTDPPPPPPTDPPPPPVEVTLPPAESIAPTP
ncbi:MAG TPA: transglycosylase domain-containing protein [Candidatus Limnocylindrales bacterium]|nr:transglycosylase domain-containing protein [Candidatus Limnocylindrales bacterium]